VVVLLLGLGLFLWIDGERRQREGARQAAIEVALQEAERHRGAGEWAAALASAERAIELGHSGKEVEEIRAEAHAAEEAAAQREREREFLAELATIRTDRMVSRESVESRFTAMPAFAGVGEADESYRRAFGRRGIHLSARADVPEAVSRLRAEFPGVLEDLAAALDEWAFLQATRKVGAGTSPGLLFEVADRLDPDPVRRRLRAALATEDGAALERVAATILVEEQGPRTLDLLGLGLRLFDRTEEARSLYRRAVLAHPRDAILRWHLITAVANRSTEPRPEADRHAAALLALRPDFPDAWRMRAAGLWVAGRHEQSMRVVETAREHWPEDEQLMGLAAANLQDLGRHDEALALARRRLALDPSDSNRWNDVGAVLADMGRGAEAIEAYRNGLDRDPANGMVRRNLARNLRVGGRPEEAVELLEPWLTRTAGPAGRGMWDEYIESLLELEQNEKALESLDAMHRMHTGAAEVPRLRGKVLWKMERFPEALAALDRALEIDPGHLQAQILRAVVLEDLERRDEALGAIEAVLRDHPDNAQALEARGWFHVESGDPGRGLADFDACVRLVPYHAYFHHCRGHALRAGGRLEESVRAYREALRLAPRSWKYALNLAVSLGDRGRLDEAEAVIRSALKDHPEQLNLLGSLAELLTRQGKEREAVEACRRLEKLAAESTVLSNIAVLLTQLGRLQDAERLLRRAIALDADDASAWHNLCVVLHRAGRLDETIAATRRALELRPDHLIDAVNLTGLLMQTGRLEEALAWSREVISRHPGESQPRTSHVTVLMQLGRLEKALAAAREAVRLLPEDASARTTLGWVLVAREDPAAAEPVLRRALELDPDSTHARVNLAAALRMLGRTDEALRHCDRAIRLDPKAGSAYQERGQILHDLGRKGPARDAYAKAIELDPTLGPRLLPLLALLSNELGDAAGTEEYLRRAARADPTRVAVHDGLLEILLTTRRFSELSEAARAAVEAVPDHAKFYWYLGQACHQLRQGPAAVDAYRKGIERSPEPPLLVQLYTMLGGAYVDCFRDYGRAIEAFRKAIEIDDGNWKTHEFLGIALASSGKRDEAVEAWRRAGELEPRSRSLGWWAGAVAQRGDLDTARKALEKALAANPRNYAALQTLGWIHIQEGDLEAAIDRLRAAREVQPNHLQTLVSLTYALQLKRPATIGEESRRLADEMVDVARAAARLAPNHPQAHANLVDVLFAAGRYDEARRRGEHLATLPLPADLRKRVDRVVADAGALAALEPRLADLLSGASKPTTPKERAYLGILLAAKHHDQVARAARELDRALEEEPALKADDLVFLGWAASAALQAGLAAGEAAGLSDEDRAAWRKKALAREREILEVLLRRADPQRRAGVLRNLRLDSELAPVREDAPLSRLPEDEQRAWRAFWKDVAAAKEAAEKAQRR
jgi:tetratricopeptide (TPR) repeat protein